MSAGKRLLSIKEKIEPNRWYSLSEALTFLKTHSKVKFRESVDVSVRLGINPKKSDQSVRGASVLPHGLGKEVRVAVFTTADKAQTARDAGADAVGLEDLAERVKDGSFDYDRVIASPDAMAVVGQLGQLLGPRGLMPNPKTGTVSDNLAAAVRNAKAGQVHFKNDKAGIVHASIGHVDFTEPQLEENLRALIADLLKAKPAASKGVYIRKVSISSTMGPSLDVTQSSLA